MLDISNIKEKSNYIKEYIRLIEDFSRDILFSLTQEIMYIKTENNFVKIEKHFDNINIILSNIEKFIWEDSFNFNQKIYRIAKDFDRIDDLETRKYLTKEIKNGKYDEFFN